MKTKNLVVFITPLIILILAGATYLLYDKTLISTVLAPEHSTALTVQDKKITDDTKPFSIEVTYPYINGLDDFNKKVQDFIDKKINDFKEYCLENDAAVKKTDPAGYAQFPRMYDLIIAYEKGEVDNNVVSIVFNTYAFEGGAHGINTSVALNYSPKLKTDIQLADLFPEQPNYLKKISDFCIEDLIKQMTAGDVYNYADDSWLQDGAGPKPENYSVFLINKNNIIFYFQQYQVAAGVAGSFKVAMPR